MLIDTAYALQFFFFGLLFTKVLYVYVDEQISEYGIKKYVKIVMDLSRQMVFLNTA